MEDAMILNKDTQRSEFIYQLKSNIVYYKI